MATIKDVAKLAGVSISTVSYALNNVNKVSPDTKRKIEEAAKELNYQKNGLASDLKRTKTSTIALILSDLSGPFYTELIKGVQDVAVKNGYDLIACSSVGGTQSTAVKFLKEKRVDGVIILAHNISDEIIMESAREGFPIVVLDRNLKNDHVLRVEVDNLQGGYLATEFLIKKGYSKIAYVSGPDNSRDNRMRLIGYMEAMKDYGIHCHPKWKFSGDYTRDGGYRATKVMIAQGELPEAVFYANDEMALGGMQAFTECAINVPEDVSIVGFDDIQLAEYISPALTTIRQPKYEAGALSGHLIFQKLAGNRVKMYNKLSTELIERGSVKCEQRGQALVE
jgi:LacI family transcriptional regulator